MVIICILFQCLKYIMSETWKPPKKAASPWAFSCTKETLLNEDLWVVTLPPPPLPPQWVIVTREWRGSYPP